MELDVADQATLVVNRGQRNGSTARRKHAQLIEPLHVCCIVRTVLYCVARASALGWRGPLPPSPARGDARGAVNNTSVPQRFSCITNSINTNESSVIDRRHLHGRCLRSLTHLLSCLSCRWHASGERERGKHSAGTYIHCLSATLSLVREGRPPRARESSTRDERTRCLRDLY